MCRRWGLGLLVAWSLVAVMPTTAGADGENVPPPSVDLLMIADTCSGEGCAEPIRRHEIATWLVEVLIDAGKASLRSDIGRFVDVEPDASYADHVETFAALGITDGCATEPTRYCPDLTLTRGQMAALLVRAFDVPALHGQGPRFSDVANGDLFAEAIRRLAVSGIAVGYPDGTFRPGAQVTRWQMTVFLRRAAAQAWGTWRTLSQNINKDSCTATFRQTLTGAVYIRTMPCRPPLLAEYSVIGFDRRVRTWVASVPCEHLRRTTHVFPGALNVKEREEVTVISVSFDDQPAPEERYIGELGATPKQRFIDELLAAAEVKLEALSHGHTDWVFHRVGEVTLPGSAHSRATPVNRGRETLHGMVSELQGRYPGQRLLAFTQNSSEFPYASFAVDKVSSVALKESYPYKSRRDADLEAFTWSHHRFGSALSGVAHELLHQFGLEDLYQTITDDGRGPPNPRNTDLRENSLMGLSGYGWGLGRLTEQEVSRGANATLAGLSAQYPHQPFTGWNKWLLGWLDGSEAVCVPPAEPTTVVVRPHQRATLPTQQVNPGAVDDCWRRSVGSHWGPAAPNPSIAIIPISLTTAVVIEADPFAAHGPPGVPQCFIGELPYSQHQCIAPGDHKGGGLATRSGRPVGDIIVYDVDLTTHHRPQLLVTPTVALVSPAKYEQLAPLYGPTGPIGKHFAPGGQLADEGSRGPWPDGLPVGCYFATEITIHRHRIAVAESTTNADGLPEIHVTIEPA